MSEALPAAGPSSKAVVPSVLGVRRSSSTSRLGWERGVCRDPWGARRGVRANSLRIQDRVVIGSLLLGPHGAHHGRGRGAGGKPYGSGQEASRRVDRAPGPILQRAWWAARIALAVVLPTADNCGKTGANFFGMPNHVGRAE